jgi:hypothetical protein
MSRFLQIVLRQNSIWRIRTEISIATHLRFGRPESDHEVNQRHFIWPQATSGMSAGILPLPPHIGQSQFRLSSDAFVAMMQSADFSDLNDPAGL